MPHQLVREAVSEVSIPNPLAAYRPSSDCICDKQIQRSPNCDHRHESEELHDQLKLLAQNSKHIAHRREQRLLCVKVGLRGGMESLQIYLI
jgi:hypothetical protein